MSDTSTGRNDPWRAGNGVLRLARRRAAADRVTGDNAATIRAPNRPDPLDRNPMAQIYLTRLRTGQRP